MRLHADEPAFHAALVHRPPGDKQSVAVLLDGVEQRDVIMADEEAGALLVYVRDGFGNFTLDANGNVPTVTLFGQVQIILPSWWPR